MRFFGPPIASSLAAICLLPQAVLADQLKVSLPGVGPEGVMADRYAFCPPAGAAQADVSPGVTWSSGPSGTRAYALRMQDLDVPADLAQIEKPGVTIQEEAPRISVDHWLLADIPAGLHALPEGADSTKFVRGGKPAGATDHGRRGTNAYAGFFAADPAMAGPYGGYDGPCPPSNDMKPHRYVVTVFAVDVDELKLDSGFTGEALARALTGHILAEGQASATYSRWKEQP